MKSNLFFILHLFPPLAKKAEQSAEYRAKPKKNIYDTAKKKNEHKIKWRI